MLARYMKITNRGKEVTKSRIFAFRHALSISSSVTSEDGFVAPSKILNRIVPAYKVFDGPSVGLANIETKFRDTYRFL